MKAYKESLPHPHGAMLDQVMSCSAIGAHASVAAQIDAFVQSTTADELMITSQIYDHGARLRSFEIAARSMLR